MFEPSAGLNPAPFEKSLLRDALKERQSEATVDDIHVHRETTSTNDEATKLARDGAPEKTLVLAESQTAGRGRRGNAWSSPPGRDLLFSLVLRPPSHLQTEQLSRLPHLVGVAICRAIEEICPTIETKLKWPNDVYIQGKKVAGILVESSSGSGQAFSIAGIGINVNSLSEDRPEELRASATSLCEETGENINRHLIAAAFLTNFHQLYPDGLEKFAEILAVIEERSLLLGAKISARLGTTKITGKVIEYGNNGELIIEIDNNGKTIKQVLNSADEVRLL